MSIQFNTVPAASYASHRLSYCATTLHHIYTIVAEMIICTHFTCSCKCAQGFQRGALLGAVIFEFELV